MDVPEPRDRRVARDRQRLVRLRPDERRRLEQTTGVALLGFGATVAIDAAR